MYCRRWLWKI